MTCPAACLPSGMVGGPRWGGRKARNNAGPQCGLEDSAATAHRITKETGRETGRETANKSSEESEFCGTAEVAVCVEGSGL